jgi:putative inorganic carbon (HCO3(-)) transporter
LKNYTRGVFETRLDQAMWLCLLTMTAAAPLVFSPHTFIQSLLAKLALISFLLFFLYSLWAVKFIVLSNQEVRYGTSMSLVAIFVVLVILSTMFSLHLHTAVWGKYSRFAGLWTILIYVATFLIASNFTWNKANINTLLKILVTISGLISLHALAQFIGFNFFSWQTSFSKGRAFANFGNPVFLGSYLAMMFPISSVLTFIEKQRYQKYFWLFLNLLILASLLVTFSRGAWVAGFFGGIIIVWISVSRRLINWRQFAAMIIAILTVISLISWTSANVGGAKPFNNIWSRALSLFRPGKGSALWRLEIWQGALFLIKNRPFLGYGPDNFAWAYPRFETVSEAKISGTNWRIDNAHNWFLQLASTIGLPATIIFVFIFLRIIYFSLKKTNKHFDDNLSYLLVGIGTALMAYLVSLLTGISIVAGTFIFWLLAGVVASFMLNQRKLYQKSLNYFFGGLSALTAIFLLILAVGYSRYYIAEGWRWRSLVYKGNNYNAASVALNKAISIVPTESRYYLQLGELNIELGKTAQNLAYFRKAVNQLTTAKRLNRYDVQNYLSLAKAEYFAGSYGVKKYWLDAKSDLETAKRLAPNSVEILHRLAIVDLQLGYIDLAEKNLKQALEIYPTEAAFYLTQGQLYESKGLINKAKQSYLKVIKLKPEGASADNARRRLRKLNIRPRKF